jgi:Uma2 family endonuclease
MSLASPVRRFTRQEFHRMADAGVFADSERLELLEGEILMTPPQEPAHAEVTSTLARLLAGAYPNCMVRQHSPLVCNDTTEPEPDIVVMPLISYRERHPRADEALLVVEVMQTSHERDLRKAAIYLQAGVPCLWLVDLVTARIEVHVGLGPHVAVSVLAGDDRLSPPGSAMSWNAAELLGG